MSFPWWKTCWWVGARLSWVEGRGVEDGRRSLLFFHIETLTGSHLYQPRLEGLGGLLWQRDSIGAVPKGGDWAEVSKGGRNTRAGSNRVTKSRREAEGLRLQSQRWANHTIVFRSMGTFIWARWKRESPRHVQLNAKTLLSLLGGFDMMSFTHFDLFHLT